MTQEKAIVKWKGEQITVSFHEVKTLICPLATDQETAIFLKTCQSLQLNPFAGECYLIKYSDEDKAAFVISINSYLKAAEVNDSYNGCEAGIILRDSGGKLEFRGGAFLLDDEKGKLAGGWARVYRKDRDRPTYMAVNKAECIRLTKYGKPTRFWTEEKQPSMLRKVALKRALVEAFPSLFAGTLSTAEVAGDVTEDEYEMAEGELPPAMEKQGKPDWKKFWARVKSELGLTTEQARELLKVDSIKEELIDQGWTMEQIWDSLVAALQEKSQKVGAAAPTKIKPNQADWRGFWENAEQLGLTRARVCEMLEVTSVVEWTDQGKTIGEAIMVISKKLSQPEAAEGEAQQAQVVDVQTGEIITQDEDLEKELFGVVSKRLSEAKTETEEVTGEGFNIDKVWLNEALGKLKWNEATAWSFVTSQYKVDGSGTFTQTLKRLTREQAEDFTKEINSRVERQQPKFI